MALESDEEIIGAFLEFFKNYTNFDGEYVYLDRINAMIKDGERSVTIDFDDLQLMDTTHELDLTSTLLEYPEHALEMACEALTEQVKEENFPFYQEVKINHQKFTARFANVPAKINIREIRSNHVNTIKWIDGIVVRASQIKPIIVEAHFVCKLNPEHQGTIPQYNANYQPPTHCFEPTCKSKEFILVVEESKLIDWQSITVQESPDELPPGVSPKSIPCRLLDDIVDSARPGDRVKLGGIVRTSADKPLRKGQTLRFDLWIDTNYLETFDKETDLSEITAEEEAEFQELADDPQLYQKVISSIAPQIKGMEREKEAIMLFLFAGVDKIFPNGFKTRGQSHVLFLGDPGVAKSQLLKSAKAIAPRGVYTSGKGSSAAGLTAAIARDPDTNEITLEAGAMVLADRGVCLTADTSILTENGIEMQIADIVDKQIPTKVLSFDETTFQLSYKNIVATSKRFSSDVYELTFSSGDTIKVSKEHPLPVWEGGINWKSVEHTQVGDTLIDYRDYPIPSKNEYFGITEDYAEWLGLIVADGSLNKNGYRILFYTKSDEVAQRYYELCNILFQKTPSESIDKRNNVRQIRLYSKEIFTQITQLGVPFTNKSKSKTIIPLLMSAPKNIINAYLCGLITGDGSVSNRIGGGIIDIIFGNFDSAEFTRKLLRRLGIISKVHTISSYGGGVVATGNYTTYKVSITGVANISRLNPSRLLSYKKLNYDAILKRKDKSDTLPHLQQIYTSISNILPHGSKHILYTNSIRKSTLNTIAINRTIVNNSLNILQEYENVFETEEYQLLQKIIKNDVHFIKVVNKRKIEPQWVYNLDVEKNSTYFANYIGVHNCLIDELDKMDEKDRSAIHEAMEQQTISIAKAGIVATLNSRTGVLAAANPKNGRYEDRRPFRENVNLSEPILSRFDLIFILRDIADEKADADKAQHILSMHLNHSTSTTDTPPIPIETLRKYIAYAKQKSHPALTQEATNIIQDFYVNMRNANKKSDNKITITARQLEGIVRLAEARARVGLHTKVRKEDAERAIDLITYSLNQIAIDPETGELDYDAFASGITTKRRNKLSMLLEITERLSNEKMGGSFTDAELYQAAELEGLDMDFVSKTLPELVRSGTLYRPHKGELKRS